MITEKEMRRLQLRGMLEYIPEIMLLLQFVIIPLAFVFGVVFYLALLGYIEIFREIFGEIFDFLGFLGFLN
ncbi:MAG: hypothetical protein LBG61_03265 [Burkholderiales bacterium]|jgi:hypothetical protein|nr:hypothetical protein [Burkholderiales bacterium]